MKSLFRMTGLALMLGGLGALAYYFLYFDTSVGVPNGSLIGIDRVNNLSLMQRRSDGLLISFLATIVGISLIYLGRDSTVGIRANHKKCPHCAEKVKIEATICMHCRNPI